MKEKSLAQLKRDAASGNIMFEMTEWHGKTGNDIPELCRGIRKVVKVNTVAITLLANSNKEIELRFPAASLISYDGENLLVYEAQERALTETEEKAWEAIQDLYKSSPAYASIYALKDEAEEITRNAGCPWIYAGKKMHGKYHDYCRNVIRDDRVRGDVVLRYKIHWIESGHGSDNGKLGEIFNGYDGPSPKEYDWGKPAGREVW